MGFMVMVFAAVFLAIISQIYDGSKLLGVIKQLLPQVYSKKLKAVLIAVLVVYNIYFLIFINYWMNSVFRNYSGSIPDNFFSKYIIIYPTFIIFLMSLQMAILLLLADFIIYLLNKSILKNSPKRKLYKAFVNLAIIVFVGIYVPARIIYDFNSININKVEIKKANLADGLKNLRIVFVSDFHADSFTYKDRLGKFIEKVNEQKPDLVLIGGDFVSRGDEYVKMAAEYTGMIKAKYGVYSCIGDHDNWIYRNDVQKSISAITEALGNVNVKMLGNQNVQLLINDAKVKITFVTNTYIEKAHIQTVNNIIRNKNDSDFRIMVTHQPGSSLIDDAEQNGYDLFLAGHTHGGQITFLFPFYNLTPTRIETKYVKGEFLKDQMLLYVTRGLGMSVLPVRYNSTPEIVDITLSR